MIKRKKEREKKRDFLSKSINKNKILSYGLKLHVNIR